MVHPLPVITEIGPSPRVIFECLTRAWEVATSDRSACLTDYEWTYLRLNEDGTPAAGNYRNWPKSASDLRMFDPCMGSGHFRSECLPDRLRVDLLAVERGWYTRCR